MSPRSFNRLRRFAGLARRLLFRHVTAFAVQSQDYADRLRQLGVAPDRLMVTGSVKYDGAASDRETPRAVELRRLLGFTTLASPPFVWVAGSTHAPEESIVLDVFGRLRGRFPALKLVLVPRHPDRFAEVAELVKRSGLGFVRRSEITGPLPGPPAVVLLDTVGELGAAWSLADVGFTGGSLDGKRGGQSMIEPAGYGVPVVFGPHVWNFRDAAGRLVESGGAIMISDARGLEAAMARLLEDASMRRRMGEAAQELVRQQQGATARTIDVIDQTLDH
jgi:3-deoxy-D-manno-octulosonic-acid transferase